MTDIIFEYNGVAHKIDTPEAMMKALGQSPGRKLIMVDEGGEVVGAGQGVAMLNRSVPLVKAMRESAQQQPLRKADNKRVLFTKGKSSGSLAKSHTSSVGSVSELQKLLKKSESLLKKGTSITVETDGYDGDIGSDIDDLYGYCNDLEGRLSEAEESLDRILAYLGNLSVKGILPAQA